MVRDGRREFGEALASRKAGLVCPAGSGTPFDELKPEFYADSWMLSDAVLGEWEVITSTSPPLGLVDRQGKPLLDLGASDQWIRLETGLTSTITRAITRAPSPSDSCSYHEVLSAKLQPRRLSGYDHNDQDGLGVLRGVYAPGGLAAPALITGLLRSMDAIHEIHGATKTTQELAQDSGRSLLRGPLAHAQQHARAFMFAIADSMGGSEYGISRTGFLPDDLAYKYTEIIEDPIKGEVVAWSIPTEDFILRTAIHVTDRVKGSELDRTGEHAVLYPAGTRLGDIEITEPTIGCPGSRVAYAMWDTAVSAATQAGLWQKS